MQVFKSNKRDISLNFPVSRGQKVKTIGQEHVIYNINNRVKG